MEYKVPVNLCLKRVACFYCGGTDEDIRSFRVFRNWGIYYCPAHFPEAERDCRRYMEEEGIMHIHFSLVTEAVMEAEFRVRRSSGEVEEGWKLAHQKYHDHDFLTYITFNRKGGEWRAPMWCKKTLDYKRVGLSKLMELNPDISNILGGFCEMIEEYGHRPFLFDPVVGILTPTPNGGNRMVPGDQHL